MCAISHHQSLYFVCVSIVRWEHQENKFKALVCFYFKLLGLVCERQSASAVGDPQCNQKPSLSPGGGVLTSHHKPEEAWSVPDIIMALDVSTSAALHG